MSIRHNHIHQADGHQGMRTTAKLFLAAVVVMACVLGLGYWHAATHASLSLRVEDYGLQTDRQLYGTPHGVTLAFYGATNEFLASAHSIEPAGYILAIHPDPDIGDCSQYENAREKYANCFTAHSTWASHWAPRVRTATVNSGACVLEKLPVRVYSSAEWWLWWVPLPHVGGVPRRYFDLAVKLNIRSCTAVLP